MYARTHHYTFAHRALSGLFHSNPAHFMHLVGKEGDMFLHFYWHRVAERLPDEQRLPPIGLGVDLYETDNGSQVAVITLPPPEGVTEAHLTAACYRPPEEEGGDDGLARYFTLEKGASFDEPRTALCEWTRDGVHMNYGTGPDPEVEALLTVLIERFEV
jgi:hypothetical protein